VAIHHKKILTKFGYNHFLNIYEMNFISIYKKKRENIVLLFLATYFGTKYGNMAIFISKI
jgi:hypothetical protein